MVLLMLSKHILKKNKLN